MRPHFILSGITALALLTAGCAGLTELPMYWGNNAGSADIKPTGYHADTKTGWMSYNDNTHIYFAFSFFDPRFQTRILSTGMTVFIDLTGKMKEDCFVRFPLIKREIVSSFQAGQKLQARQGTLGRGQRTSTETLLDQAQGFELQWQNGKDVIQVNPSLEKTEFKTSIGLDSTHALNIVVGVPLKMIQPAGLSALDKLVIGLRFGQTPTASDMGSRPQMAGNQQAVLGGSNAGTGGGSGGGGRGGRGGGGGGGRGGSGGGGNSGGSGGNSNASQIDAGGAGGRSGMDNSPVEFWYKTKLVKK